MKLNPILLALTILTVNTVQAESSYFMGGYLGVPNVITEYESDYDQPSTTEHSKSAIFVGIKLGRNEKHFRYYAMYDSAVAKHQASYISSLSYTAIGGNIDWLWNIHKKAALFVGPHAKLIHVNFYDKESEAGFGWGGQVGSLLEVTDNIDLEVGYQYTKTSIKADINYLNHGTEEFKSSKVIYAGLSCKF